MKTVTYNFGSNGTVQRCTSTMQHCAGVIDSGISGTQSTDTIVTTDITLNSTNNQQDLCRCCSKGKCIELAKKRIPIATWLPKYKAYYIPQDILAGITVGLTAIPQGIAYAGVAGLPLQYGLYSGIMGCFVYLILGSCKDVVVGPTAIMALMIQPHVTAMGPDIAVLACFLSGCIVFILGIFQLGFLVDFISFPVVSGFTSAAALTIGSSQLKGLFGIKGKSNEFLPAWQAVFEHISEAILADSLLSVGSIVFLVFAKWIGKYGNRKYNPEWSPRRNMLGKLLWIFSLSRNAIIVIFGTFLAWSLSSENMETPFKIIGKVGEGLPPFNIPPFSTQFNNTTYTFEDMAKQLGTTIIFMPLVAILESIAISKAFAKGKSVDATQELIALGFCNIAGSFVRSMSITGSFTRTALNHNSGAVTTLGGVYTAILVILSLELLTSTFSFIPKATLSSVIIVAMVHMVEIEAAILLWKTKKSELLLYLITLVASLFLGVEYGIVIGITTNILFILYASARPSVSLEKTHIGFKDVIIVTPTQSLHFPAAEYVRRKITDQCEKEYDVVIDGKFIMHIDMTVAKNIKILIEDMKVREQNVLLWNFKHDVKKYCTALDPSLDKNFFEGNLENIIRKSSLVQVETEVNIQSIHANIQ